MPFVIAALARSHFPTKEHAFGETSLPSRDDRKFNEKIINDLQIISLHTCLCFSSDLFLSVHRDRINILIRNGLAAVIKKVLKHVFSRKNRESGAKTAQRIKISFDMAAHTKKLLFKRPRKAWAADEMLMFMT